MKIMEKIIAACGNNCAACPRYVAHPYEKTAEELRHTAELWMRIGYRDHVVTNEEIACHGCKPENWCRYRVVKCCMDRGIRTCRECAEYPCDNMRDCFAVTKSGSTLMSMSLILVLESLLRVTILNTAPHISIAFLNILYLLARFIL